MKNKRIFLAIIALLLATLACSTSPSATPPLIIPTFTQSPNGANAQATRQATIAESAYIFSQESSWSLVPTTCANSMAKIWLHSPTNQEKSEISSSSVIESKVYQDQSGNLRFVYWIQTTNHSVNLESGEVLNDYVEIFPVRSNAKLLYDFVDYKQIVDENGNHLDSGILTIFTTDQQSKLENYNLTPLHIPNIVSGYEIQSNEGVYYSFDYPNAGPAQFTVSTIFRPGSTETNEPMLIAQIIDGSSTVSIGSSGAAICNSEGKHVGVMASFTENWATSFRIIPNPPNIQTQINETLNSAYLKLIEQGFTATN